MTLTHQIDVAARRITITGASTCTFDEILELLLRVAADDGAMPEYGVLVDMQQTSVVLTDEDRSHLAELLGRLARRFRGRVALTRTGVGERIGAELIALGAAAGGLDMQVFSDVPSAIRWLDEAT